jgi:hypothetical protein
MVEVKPQDLRVLHRELSVKGQNNYRWCMAFYPDTDPYDLPKAERFVLEETKSQYTFKQIYDSLCYYN